MLIQPKTIQKPPSTHHYRENLILNLWKFSNLNKNYKFWIKIWKFIKKEKKFIWKKIFLFLFFFLFFFLRHLLRSALYLSSFSFILFFPSSTHSTTPQSLLNPNQPNKTCGSARPCQAKLMAARVVVKLAHSFRVG